MGIAEIGNEYLLIHSHIIIYGNAADSAITEMIRDEVETMWNEPEGVIVLREQPYKVIFRITAEYIPDLSALDIYQNLDPRNNYFRIEEYAHVNISFVDAIGCNSGYFKLDNLYKGSTTAAHEYGHTLGLVHPDDLDIRGQGVPGIMYPRGTITDPPYQYNPGAEPGDNTNGGTMHPKFRKVRKEDIKQLKLHKLSFENEKAIIGGFTSVWHPDHKDISPDEFFQTGIMA